VTTGASVWLLDCSKLDAAGLAPFEAWLGESERARLLRFVRPERRRQFVAGRALLRQLLAPAMQLAPAQVALIERAGNAPLLSLGVGHIPPHPQFFSLSHSGPWVACAFSTSTSLGLDIERLDASRDFAALAAHAFDQPRQAWLAAQPAFERMSAFYRLWCGAEARFKLGQAAAAEVHLPHAELAITLCTAATLTSPPQLRLASLGTPENNLYNAQQPYVTAAPQPAHTAKAR
jgi:4'-phosphopantetheinyl transferase